MIGGDSTHVTPPIWDYPPPFKQALKNKLGDQMIKQYYWTWLSQNIVICRFLRDQSLASALLIANKSRYFAQPCLIITIIANYFFVTSHIARFFDENIEHCQQIRHTLLTKPETTDKPWTCAYDDMYFKGQM